MTDEIKSEWARDLVAVLKDHDSPTFNNLYYYMERYRKKHGYSWPKTAKSTIRNVLQRHCRTCPQYQGGPDLFEKLVLGCWRLRKQVVT
jgi:hypothetical protein